MRKKLYRSRSKVIAGVCGGLGDYFNIHPAVFRIIFLVFIVAGFGFLLYLISWILIPKEPDAANYDNHSTYNYKI